MCGRIRSNKGAGTKSCKSPHRPSCNLQECYQYTITAGSIMLRTRDSASSGYGRSKVPRLNRGGPSQACVLVRSCCILNTTVIHTEWQSFRPYGLCCRRLHFVGVANKSKYIWSRNRIRDVFHSIPASDRLKVTASQSATCCTPSEREEINVVFNSNLQDVSETSYESGYEYTQEPDERLHIECAPIVSIQSREPLLDNTVTLQGDTKSLESPKGICEGHESNWGLLPGEIQGCVLSNLKYEDLFQVKLVCKGIQELIKSPAFLSSRGDTVREEGLLTSLYLYVKNGALQWSGYDLVLKKWRPLPKLGCLPSPDIDLFKDYLVASGGGLLCANVSSSPHNEKLVVCNPMTQTRRDLPPLNFPRNPVLMHMLVNPATKSYKVIVAGSAGMTEGLTLSRKTEVFDSLTSQWEVTDDLPGPEFSLNEYQTGVCINGILYCIAFMEDGSGKGVLAYNVEEGKWLSDWKCPLPCPGNASSFSIAQLVECDGEVYLFSEREASRTVEHGIHKLEHTSGGTWKNVVKETRTGGRGLLLYPEYACAGFGAGKLCVFNTIEHTGKVYDIHNAGLVEPLPPIVKSKGGEMFHSLNPLSFTFEPNFQSAVRF